MLIDCRELCNVRMELCAINVLDSSERNFSSKLDTLTSWQSVTDNDVEAVVDEIIFEVKKRGDSALLEYTKLYDGLICENSDQLIVHQHQLDTALDSLDDDLRAALEIAASRISDYHMHQLEKSWQFSEADGTSLGLSLIHI